MYHMSSVKQGVTPYCFFYQSEDYKKLDSCGKWIHFFSKSNYHFVKEVCVRAIKENVVTTTKHSSFEKESLPNPLSTNKDTGVICFYIDGTSDECHKRVLKYMIKNDLIQRTKTGKLFNIAYKFDSQTLNNEYGDDFIAQTKLDNYVDLETGKLLK